MKRSIWIFLLAIVLPSIGLGWLALRSANEQQIILERRTAELYQKETDAVASEARGLIEEERRGFAERVRQLLARCGHPSCSALRSRALDRFLTCGSRPGPEGCESSLGALRSQLRCPRAHPQFEYHRHYRGGETAYAFTTVEQLMADFWSDVRALRGDK